MGTVASVAECAITADSAAEFRTMSQKSPHLEEIQDPRLNINVKVILPRPSANIVKMKLKLCTRLQVTHALK